MRPRVSLGLQLVLVAEARPAQPLPVRNGLHSVAFLVNPEVAALAEDNHVGRLAVPLATHHTHRVPVGL
eukprot:scaffold650228_cov42-Prasinocladus_malaysianus.AAC.1